VRVFVLVSVGSIEEEILERARSKMGIDAKVIQAGLFNQSSTAAVSG
jgi:SNF2 family DNA or RNA helicase